MKMLAVINKERFSKKLIETFIEKNNITGINDPSDHDLYPRALFMRNDISLAMDPSGITGLLFKKVPLSDFFPSEIDISEYVNARIQLSEIDDNGYDPIPDKYNTTLKSFHVTNLTPGGYTNIPSETIRAFELTCLYLGISNLTLDEVDILAGGGYLHIAARSNNSYYTGSMKVKYK